MDPSDEELIEGVQRGSEECFRSLYVRYKLPLFNYLYHFLKERQAAEDCLQDVFIRLYQKAKMYQPSSKFSSWLYQMAKNAALDVLRKSKTHQAASLDAPLKTEESGATLTDFIKSGDADPRSLSISKDLASLVHAAIAKLEESDREIIILCDIQRLPHKEVGEIMGYSAETIAVKLYRARQKLAGILKIEDL